MDLLIPSTGLLFWMTITFLVVFFLLWKFGFPVITGMVKERQAFIDESLKKAHEANERLANIQKERLTRLTNDWPTFKRKVNPSCRRHARSRLRY